MKAIFDAGVNEISRNGEMTRRFYLAFVRKISWADYGYTLPLGLSIR